jgi:hypothetical protein
MATAMAKSGLFGAKTPEAALALMLLAQSEGMHPATAARDYHIIQGRPALKADTMLARFQQAGGTVEWKDYTDAKVVGVFSHPKGGTVSVEWNTERAKTAGLLAKDGPWKTYPRAMMRARCISEGVRTCFPGVAIGTYTVEEAQDMEPADVTPVRVADAMQQATDSATRLTEEEIAEHLSTINSAGGMVELADAFAKAWKHGKEAKDAVAQGKFKQAYDFAKAMLESEAP